VTRLGRCASLHYAGPDVVRAVVCRAGGRLCALEVDAVAETMRPLPLHKVPSSADFVLGMAIVREVPTLVLDAGRLLGDRPSTLGRFVTVRVGARFVALAVDEVIGVRALPADAMAQLPPLVSRTAIEQVATVDRELMVVLDAARLVPDKLFDELERSI
jgi:purine-binding chemotaxis protein CheW